MAATKEHLPSDASMDLLNQIIRQPLDPDYAAVAGAGGSRVRSRWLLGGAAVLIGTMFAVAALQTTRAAPVLEAERSELISRVQAAEQDQDELRDRSAVLNGQIRSLRSGALGDDAGDRVLTDRVNTLGPVVGEVAVDGPGVQIVVDDAPTESGDARDRVLDLDLQVLANGLWQSGAEAVAINGHRLSALTAIRSAGDAITVDYRSLSRPYEVEAIGDPRTLQARFAESGSGAWWNELAQNRRMKYEINDMTKLHLAADPGIALRYAKATR